MCWIRDRKALFVMNQDAVTSGTTAAGGRSGGGFETKKTDTFSQHLTSQPGAEAALRPGLTAPSSVAGASA